MYESSRSKSTGKAFKRTNAGEPEPAAYEAEYPALETVRPDLAEDEIVTAEDYEMEIGSNFDIENDFAGLEIPAEKVTVKFHEAKNNAGQDFHVDQADIYKAVYFIEPVSGNPSYHVSRNIIVREKPDTSQSGGESANDQGDLSKEPVQGDAETDPDLETDTPESMTEAEMEAVIEDMEAAA